MSNYTGELTDQGCADLKAAGYVGAIVQAITGRDGVSWTRQQLHACARNGLRIQGYVWCFPGASKASMSSRLGMFDGSNIERLWLDVEQAGLKASDVDRDLSVCDHYMSAKVGCYSGRWFFARQGWLGHTAWSDRLLWDSHYNGEPVVGAGFIPYAGWTVPTMSQFAGTSSVGSVHEIDLNVA